MTPNEFTFGFRIVGDLHNERRLVEADRALVGHAECNPEADIEREVYLSAFQFADDFATHLRKTGSTKNYFGPTWAKWLWFDIDRDELEAATNDARRLVAVLMDRYALAGDELLLFHSGSKGYHVGLPLSICGTPNPSSNFHLACRRFAENVASVANLAIDSGVYDRVRAFRAPNSRHSKTGRHKRFIELDALMHLTPSRLVELSAEPIPFELPNEPRANPQAFRDWQAAVASIDAERATATQRRDTNGKSTLNRSTLAFIREGAANGDRHRLLFSSAANLGELGCSFELAWALLSESALDSGLAPSEVRRQIECGLNHRGTP